MNVDRLLGHYERIADAPEAVSRLRRFILDLAVRGKLVEQDPNDEPATELLNRIAEEKARLVKAGEFREPRNAVEIKRDELPFVPAVHWEWSRLIDIARPSYGFAFQSSEFNTDKRGMPLIRIRDISKTDTVAYYEGDFDPTYLVRAGDYLVGMDGDFNLLRWQGLDGLLNQRVMRINGWRCDVDSEFVKLPLQMVLDYLHGATSLTTVKHLSAKQVNGIGIPLPPLPEQHRIVSKVDELMALCDRLEAARTERESTRDRMAAASLVRLNDPDPDRVVFRNHAAFAIENLAPLTTRTDQIKSLRQTILNLAVRGKLVEQDPNDEPASELLKRIAADRVTLEKNGSLKKPEPLPPVDAADTPFDLPSRWAWARFPEIGTFGRGKSKHRPRNDPLLYNGGKYPFIQTGDVARSGGLIKTYSNLYNDVGIAQSAMWPTGTLCITIAANIADSGILAFDACFPDSVVGLIAHNSFEGARFFEYFIRTSKADLHEFAPSTAQKNINLGVLTEVLIPLPPLTEQHRIVAKVDELMALCDQLATSLATGEDTRRRLLDALLYEALKETLEPFKEQRCVV